MGSAGMIGSTAVLLAGLSPRFLWPTLALVATILAGAVIIALLERWRKRPTDAGLSAGDQLSHFRRLYEKGVMSKEEFEAVKVQLADKLRHELNLTTPTAEGAPTATAEPPRPPEPPANGEIKV